jgi:hypothetical protein
LENLEESAKKEIFKNSNVWFETPLDEHDIESSMSSPYKPYKSGKYFIVRANIPIALDKINIKVYDENETETDPENIKENTKVLAVFEFQGIRCSVRSFQFEIELKQILIVEPEKLFETCIIGKTVATKREEKPEEREEKPEPDLESSEPKSDFSSSSSSSSFSSINTAPIDTEVDANADVVEVPDLDQSPENLEITSFEPIQEVPIEILDADFPLEDIAESHTEKEPPLRLKSRNDVYYRLYKEMRQRAKEAKREALASYLEAKRIKSTYLLEDVSDSDDELEDLEV